MFLQELYTNFNRILIKRIKRILLKISSWSIDNFHLMKLMRMKNPNLLLINKTTKNKNIVIVIFKNIKASKKFISLHLQMMYFSIFVMVNVY